MLNVELIYFVLKQSIDFTLYEIHKNAIQVPVEQIEMVIGTV